MRIAQFLIQRQQEKITICEATQIKKSNSRYNIQKHLTTKNMKLLSIDLSELWQMVNFATHPVGSISIYTYEIRTKK